MAIRDESNDGVKPEGEEALSPIIVSFFTPAYADHASHMEASAKQFGFETDVRGVRDLGAWELNCGLKPKFILQMLQTHRRPVVWLDADARVRRSPDLFDSLDCDFAAHWRFGAELLSGTMYFNSTGPAYGLLEAWQAAQQMSPTEWDQRTLQRVIESGFPVRVERLPSAYTRVFDDDKMGEPVIEHLQASRQLARVGSSA